jgi:hypothetical protein
MLATSLVITLSGKQQLCMQLAPVGIPHRFKFMSHRIRITS